MRASRVGVLLSFAMQRGVHEPNAADVACSSPGARSCCCGLAIVSSNTTFQNVHCSWWERLHSRAYRYNGRMRSTHHFECPRLSAAAGVVVYTVSAFSPFLAIVYGRHTQ